MNKIAVFICMSIFVAGFPPVIAEGAQTTITPIISLLLQDQVSDVPPPQNLRASKGTVLFQVYLDWDPPAVSTNGYNVYQLNEAGTSYVKLNSAPVTTLKADVFNVTPADNQFFRLASVDTSGIEGVWSDYVMGWAASPVPVNTWASRGTNTNYIYLHWDAVQVTWSNWPPSYQNLYADGYDIDWSASENGNYAPFYNYPVNNSSSSPFSFAAGGTPGVHYFFKVRAYYMDRQDLDGDGNTTEYFNGDWSAPMEGWVRPGTTTAPTYLSAPSYISATDGTYPFKIAVNWSSVAGAQYYKVYRGSSPWGPWRFIKTNSSTSFANTNTDAAYPIITNTGYYYFVCPVDNSGVQGYCSKYDGGFAASHILQR